MSRPVLSALVGVAALAAAGAASAQAYGHTYGQPYYAPPQSYQPAQGFGRQGTYLYGYGGVGAQGAYGYVAPSRGYDQSYGYSYGYGQPQAYGHAQYTVRRDCGGRYGYSACQRRYSRHEHRSSYGYGQGYAHGDFGRPDRGYRDEWGYQDDRAPAYGRVHGGYSYSQGHHGHGYGCDCPQIPLYD